MAVKKKKVENSNIEDKDIGEFAEGGVVGIDELVSELEKRGAIVIKTRASAITSIISGDNINLLKTGVRNVLLIEGCAVH